MRISWLAALIVLSGPLALAQNEANRAAIAPAPTAFQPMTVKQKFQYRMRHSFEPLSLVRVAVGAGFDEGTNTPGAWGQGWDSFGVRMASHFGQHFVKEQVMFAVEAVDHENPVHLRSHRRGWGNRLRDAVVYTFVAYNDQGKPMPEYSRFVANYASGFIAKEWWPAEYHTIGDGLESGSISLGFDVAMNVFREFWPDLKGKLHH